MVLKACLSMVLPNHVCGVTVSVCGVTTILNKDLCNYIDYKPLDLKYYFASDNKKDVINLPYLLLKRPNILNF